MRPKIIVSKNDGITAELIKYDDEPEVKLMSKIINSIYSNEYAPLSMKNAYIVLLIIKEQVKIYKT